MSSTDSSDVDYMNALNRAAWLQIQAKERLRDETAVVRAQVLDALDVAQREQAAEMDRLAWEGIQAKERQQEQAKAAHRGWLAENCADGYIAKLRGQFAADEIDLGTFEQQVALALRGIIPTGLWAASVSQPERAGRPGVSATLERRLMLFLLIYLTLVLLAAITLWVVGVIPG